MKVLLGRQMHIILVLLCLFFNLSYADSRAHQTFISISDIHFNPLAGCERYKKPCPILQALIAKPPETWQQVFSQYSLNDPIRQYQDTNPTLLLSALSELKELSHENPPAFVLVLGDYLSHTLKKDFRRFQDSRSEAEYSQFVKKIYQYLTIQLNSVFPDINIYPIIGNVDTYDDDYEVIPRGKFIQDFAYALSPLIKNPSQKQQFLQQFLNAGYYQIPLNLSSNLIALNTVLFAPKSQNAAVKVAANQELQWLNKQLALAKIEGKSVLIVCHIPMGVDFNLSSSMPFKMIKNFWVPKYSKTFTEIIKKYSDTVVGILPGHVHLDWLQFTIVGKDNQSIPIVFTPSISPNFGNNPAIKVFQFETETLRLQSFDRYEKSLQDTASIWRKSDRFSAVYRYDCEYCHLRDMVQYLIVNNYLLEFFVHYSPIKESSDEGGIMTFYWCSMVSKDINAYMHCLHGS